MDSRCRECGSERIAPGVKLAAEAPAGSLLARMRARICADCGHTALFADDPMDLYLERGGGSRPGAGRPGPGTDKPANIQCPACGSVMPAAERRCEACGWSPTEAM